MAWKAYAAPLGTRTCSFTQESLRLANHEFIQSEKEDQEIAEGCRRLIKNAIICWNYLFLTRALDKETDEARKAELIEAFRNGSVTTWRHFNLHGEFDFSDDKMIDSADLTGP